MSDLQCPATFWVVPADASCGESDVQLPVARLAAVLCGPGAAPAAVAGRLATAHGLALGQLDVAGGYRRALDELSDLYRGETVAVVVEAEALDDLTGTAGLGAAAGGPLEVRVDADGWAARRPVGVCDPEPG